MSKEYTMRDSNITAIFEIECEDGDIDCCKVYRTRKGVTEEIGFYVDLKAVNKEFERKNQKIAVLEKALELACEDFDVSFVFDKEFYNAENWYDYFKQQAEKELKDGETNI